MRIFDIAIMSIPASRKLEHYEAAFIRGYIGRIFSREPLLHHHLHNKFLYLYPRVQFKIVNGNAFIIGIDEGISIINRIETKICNTKLEQNKIEFYKPGIKFEKVKLGSANNLHTYRFETIWLALNERNFQRYIHSYNKEDILKNALIGNILSMCKGLDYSVEYNIEVNLKVEEKSATLKGTPMLGFLGQFSVNFSIPDYWGIGKSVSRGFGTVKRVKKKSEFGFT